MPLRQIKGPRRRKRAVTKTKRQTARINKLTTRGRTKTKKASRIKKRRDRTFGRLGKG